MRVTRSDLIGVPPSAEPGGTVAITPPSPADRQGGPIDREATSPASQDRPVNLETLSASWQVALDAAQAALLSARFALPDQELHERTGRLSGERAQVTHLFEAVAREEHVKARFLRLLVPSWNARRLLGLPPDVVACVFNLDGVLIGSAAVHAAAWAETFDEFISARLERTRGRFTPAPFDPGADYDRHIHAKPRLEGVRAFLASRGIRLPEGDPRDPPGTETVHGLANRKNAALLRRLDEHALTAFEGAQHYLEIARDAGVRRAAVSASANTPAILEQAGLADLIEESVDGNTMVAERLRAKPAPDTLLAACRQLGVAPRHAAVFETTPAGVAAARAAGFELVVGVDRTGGAGGLRAAGADVVIPSLAELLDRTSAA
ncbi:MAG TPA: HAD-IA family hydrolase [Gaiellaceae bacterium]